jgi:hypothetical protein
VSTRLPTQKPPPKRILLPAPGLAFTSFLRALRAPRPSFVERPGQGHGEEKARGWLFRGLPGVDLKAPKSTAGIARTACGPVPSRAGVIPHHVLDLAVRACVLDERTTKNHLFRVQAA